MLALMTALQYAGFTCSPLLGSALGLGGKSISTYWVYALPGFSIFLMAFYCVIALLTVFDNTTDEPTHSAAPAASPDTHALLAPSSSNSSDTNLSAVLAATPVPVPVSRYTSHQTGDVMNPMLPPLSEISLTDNDPTTTNTLTRHRQSHPTSLIYSKTDGTLAQSDPPEPTNTATDQSTQPLVPSTTTTNSIATPTTTGDHSFFCIITMILLNVTTKGSISVYETLGSQIALVDYNMSVFGKL